MKFTAPEADLPMAGHRVRAAVLSLAAAWSLVFAACGGSGDSSTGPTNSPGRSATTSSGDVPKTAEIDQDKLAFKPSSVTIAVGGQLTFRNSESAIHTVTIERKNESGTMKKGAAFVWTPPAAGSYKITCDFHPQMRATVTVE